MNKKIDRLKNAKATLFILPVHGSAFLPVPVPVPRLLQYRFLVLLSYLYLFL